MNTDQIVAAALRLQLEGKLADAERLYREALAGDPNHPGALTGLAEIAQAFGHHQAAADLAAGAIARAPSAIAYTTLGAALRSLNRLDEALEAFERAVALAPSDPAAHCNYAMTLGELNRWREARVAYERALKLEPEFLVALHGTMVSQVRLAEFAAAVQIGRRAAEHGLNTTNFWSDYAAALFSILDLQAAIRAAENAVALDPQNPNAHFNLAQFLLLAGDYERGWEEHEWRWTTKAFPSPRRHFEQPTWDGASDPRKTVLLHAEQGLGDAIMWARYLPLAAQRVRIVVECQEELLPLIRSISGVADVVGRGAPLPAFDAHLPFGSLPLLFETVVETIPNDVPYLLVDSAKTERWSRRLGERGTFRVGLAWAGAPMHLNDANRSMPLTLFEPLRDVPRVEFYSLQKGPAAGAARDLGWLHDFTDDFLDLADTAAFMQSLDLVLTVDTAIAHLAGAMAKPVWVMLPFAPDWRWLLSRPHDSPWYPTMRLFRQPGPGDWHDVVARVTRELRLLAHSREQRTSQ